MYNYGTAFEHSEYALLLPLNRIKCSSTNEALYNSSFAFWNFKLVLKEKKISFVSYQISISMKSSKKLSSSKVYNVYKEFTDVYVRECFAYVFL